MADPASVLMTADAVGGVWTYALELARALAPRGVEVTLAVLGPGPSSEQRAEAVEVPGLRLLDRPFRLEWMEDPWEDVARSGDWLLSLEDELRPDVVHLNGYAHGGLSFRAPVLLAAHSCVLSWWRAVHDGPAPERYDRYRTEVIRGLRGARRVVAPSRAMMRALEREHEPVAHGFVVANGRDPRRFRPRPGPRDRLIVGAGRLWDEAKNLAALDAAAPGAPWPVAIAGEPRAPGAASGSEPGPGSGPGLRHARALGRLAPLELAELLGRAAIFALPARYEPFGLSALEAALSGCALVLGDVPSLREVWGDAAEYVAPDDPAALSAALTRHAEDPRLLARRAEAARERALRFRPERMAEAYLSLYRSLTEASCG